MAGRHPSGRASQAPPQAPAGLGHPVTIPDALTRVAEALAHNDWPGCDCWADFSDVERYEYIRRARVAIRAMREPTEAMIAASNREWDGRMSHRSSGAWQAMIDAALLDSDE
jgi:hypothetical protein